MTTASELAGDLLRLQAAIDSMRETIRDYGDELSRVEAERDELQRQLQEARDERDELRAGQGRWPKEDDDSPCCGTPPRLTVHKLNVAPVGSWISRGMGSNARRKDADGKWHRAWMFEGQHPESSEDLIANGWADATLHLPEDQS